MQLLMKIALAQINTVVGDVSGNVEKAVLTLKKFGDQADLIVLPELLTVGYPTRDLLYRKDLISSNIDAADILIRATKETRAAVVFGCAQPNIVDGGKPLFNAAFAAAGGQKVNERHKSLLPTYDVFEEDIYFEPGTKDDFKVFSINGTNVGVIICEEAWNQSEFWPKHLYPFDPVAEIVKAGAQQIVVINSSPYRRGIPQLRRQMIAAHAKRHGVGIAYVNQVGYNDDVGFDGNSFAVNGGGEMIAHVQSFTEDAILFDTFDRPIPEITYEIDWQHEIIQALILGIRDYFGKQGINGPALIGLSGGIDSALVAFLATQALGKERVVGIGMPSQFSSRGSVSDAEQIAKKLGIHFAVQPIVVAHSDMRRAVDCMNHYLTGGKPDGSGPPAPELFGRKIVMCEDSGVTDENLQARIRGTYLMALANYYNGLVLSTGNKSEMAVGYCTLYGDMCGGLAVISDVYKTWVFDICRYINEMHRAEIIPWNTINKPPSAELRKDQKDSDSLPPYELLDEVVVRYVEQGKHPQEIIDDLVTEDRAMAYLGTHNRTIQDDIVRVCRMICRAQFKRIQSPTGLKVTARLFKMGYRLPIVHKLCP